MQQRTSCVIMEHFRRIGSAAKGPIELQGEDGLRGDGSPVRTITTLQPTIIINFMDSIGTLTLVYPPKCCFNSDIPLAALCGCYCRLLAAEKSQLL